MRLIGMDVMNRLHSGELHAVKMVFNERAAIVFEAERQHREMKAEGVSYEDDYKGNALAAIVRRDLIEIRFHRGFADSAVARMVRTLLRLSEFGQLATATITYQGRPVSLGESQ